MHPFLDLLTEALNLTHPRFALAYGEEYTSPEAAARRDLERPFLCEFVYQFRHLWERGLPGRLGLGHIVFQGEPTDVGPLPDLLVWQLGEQGQPDSRLGAVSLAFLSNPGAIAANGSLLARFHRELAYPLAVSIVVGRFRSEPLPAFDGVGSLRFDIDRWQVV